MKLVVRYREHDQCDVLALFKGTVYLVKPLLKWFVVVSKLNTQSATPASK